MQPAEMMPGTRAVCDILLLISLSIVYVHSFPLQVMPSIPGYIPVYIRHGDQPLEEINPALAEAFHERSFSKSLDLDKISTSSDINPVEEAADKYYNTYGVIDIRQASISENEDKKSVETANTKASETMGNKEKQRHRRKKLPVVKVSPLTEEEQEALEKYEIKISEEIKSPNIMQDSNSDRSESTSDKSKNKVENSDSVTKIDRIITDESDLPQLANNQNFSTNEEAPRKEQPLPGVLSNVYKLTPSPEILMQLEKERREKESLEEKSK